MNEADSELEQIEISDVLLEQAAHGVFPLHTMRENTQNYLRAGGLCEFSSDYQAGEKRAILSWTSSCVATC